MHIVQHSFLDILYFYNIKLTRQILLVFLKKISKRKLVFQMKKIFAYIKE